MEYEPTDLPEEGTGRASYDGPVEEEAAWDGVTCDTDGDFDLPDDNAAPGGGEEASDTVEEFPQLQSGMEIADSPARRLLGERLEDAYATWYTSYGRPSELQRASNIANSVGEVEGIEVVRPSDFGRDYDNRCGHYAFGERGGEEWATPGNDLPYGWNTSASFERNGYDMVPVPKPGDVVGYTHQTPRDVEDFGTISFEHVGVVDSDGRATSKFNQGPVVRHDIENVPGKYGSFAYFFRKRTEQPG